MPALLFQVITVVFDLSVIVFVVFYIMGLRKREQELDKKESKIESDYQMITSKSMAQEKQIVDNALNQSNQMMSVATHQANQILAGAQYISQTTKATLDNAIGKLVVDVQNVGTSSKISLDQALQKIIVDVHKEAFDTSKNVTDDYEKSLKQIVGISLSGFQNVTNELELELQKQIRDFRQQVLNNMEKEIEEYKTAKIRRIDQVSKGVVQKVAQEVLNRSLSLTDHEDLIIRSLEKAKKEGVFD